VITTEPWPRGAGNLEDPHSGAADHVVQRLRRAVDLVVVHRIREVRELVDVIGNPGRCFRQEHAPGLDCWRDGAGPAHLVAVNLDRDDRQPRIAPELLNQRLAASLVLDKDDARVELRAQRRDHRHERPEVDAALP
jgi:hypothetical protein